MRIDWTKSKSERSIEIPWMLEKIREIMPESLLDVGFAGGFYQEDIFEIIDSDKYMGLDNDLNRIKGDALWVDAETKKYWTTLLSMHNYIVGDIVSMGGAIPTSELVMSISTIEHIVPAGYAGKMNGMDADLRAVENMKKLAGKYLMLTFPVGEEKFFYNPRHNNNNKALSRIKKFIRASNNTMFYNTERIDKIIGDWTVLEEKYYKTVSDVWKECDKKVATEYKHRRSKAQTTCLLLLGRPE